MTEIGTAIEHNDTEIGDDQSDKKKKATKDEITEDNCRFTEGETLRFIRVRFPGHAKSFPFLIGKRQIVYGQKVLAMSDRGMAVGYINSFPYELDFKKSLLPIRSINKMATQEDVLKEKETYKRQKEVETICQNLIEKHNLDMNLTHVEFTQFGKKVVFYFVAPARVDFRGLVKDLVSQLKLRIELRQISVRDRAASMGALGPCGRELCCSSFLSRYGNVSIKMAKNQNLSLNYSKLNGVCGQLKCCLQYEDDVYAAKRRKLPTEGDFVSTKSGDKGTVRKLHLLSEQFDLLTTKGFIRRYTGDQFVAKVEGEEFPSQLDHIIDETSTIVGLSEKEARKAHFFEKEMERIKKRSSRYAQDLIDDFMDRGPSITDESTDTPVEIKEVDGQKTFIIREEVDTVEEKVETDSSLQEQTKSLSDSSDQNSRPRHGGERKDHRNRRKNFRNNRNKNFKNKKNPTS